MKIIFLFALLGVCLASPVPEAQAPNWPYDNSPYYYGYPGNTKYVYRASIEDDEEPLDRSRQDQGQSVTALINNAALKQQESINNYGSEKQTSVVETGSVAPVQDRPGDASSVSNAAPSNAKVPTNSQAPNVVKPGVVNPPPFPPKRVPRPPPKKPAPEEEDSDEEDEDDDDESGQDEDQDEDEEEEEEEEARRRNEPVDASEAVVLPVPENATSIESVEVTPVPAVPAGKPEKPVVVPSDKENAVDVPADEESSDENASYEGVEAFVPGYVTDQGEVLVPVDTVTGDQPISIVPDPYTPPARGIPLNYYNYNRGLNGGLPVPTPGRIYRQGGVEDEDEDDTSAADDEEPRPEAPEEEEEAEDEEDEDEEEEDDAEAEKAEKAKNKKKVAPKRPPLAFVPATAPTNEDDELESALRYRSEAFPPSRSPLLLPVTFRYNGGYLTGPFNRPVSSSEVFQYVEPTVKYAIQRRTQQPPRSPAMNIFSPYMGNNQYESQIVLRKPSRVPAPVPVSTFGYTATARRPVQRRPTTPYYVKSESTPQYVPVYYSEPQQAQYQYPAQAMHPHPGKLHNPGEKLKIKSSYELLVEPPTDVVKYKTKSRPSQKKKRPNNKRRPVPPIVLKTKVSRPGVVVASKKPAQVILRRPIYNVQPHSRVPVKQVTPYFVGAPSRPMSPYYVGGPSPMSRFPVSSAGGPGGYYPGFRPMRYPTPVIYQDEPSSDASASDEMMPMPEERKPKWKREMKKPTQAPRMKKTKKPTKQADRLGLFTKPVQKKRTSVTA